MKYRRYPRYKDSGVEWFGELPSHWVSLKLKRLADMKSGDGIPTEQINESGLYPVFGGNGIRGYTDIGYTHDGTFPLIGRQGALCGNINYASGKFWASEHAVVVTPLVGVSVRWLGELLRSMNLNQYSISAAQPGLSVEMISNLAVPVPPKAEQSAITGFLDCETTKIDTLIAKQERLIAVLQEKRQSLISHVMTKGLNADALMKDSGVEWLGDMPTHWRVKRLKHLLCEPLMYGASESGDTDNPDNPRFIRITDIDETGNLRSDTFRSLPPDAAEPYMLIDGDVLFARSGATVGKAFIYRNSWGKACFAGYLIKARPDLSVMDPQWLRFCSQTHFYWQYIAAIQIQATIQNVSAERYANLYLPCPPLQEQVEIIRYLETETNIFTGLHLKALQVISALQERRISLISAAVTGKIDVRNQMN